MEPDVVVCDLVMPGMGGVEVVDRLATVAPDTSVILLTAHGTMETALEAFRKGAADYLLKPVDPDELHHKVQRVVEHRRLEREVRYLRREVSEVRTGTRLVGNSESLAGVRRLIDKVAPVDSTVLITGESGTGKELVARSIHEAGPRREGPFVAVNCAALPRELVESELFGHVRGAFTGAYRDRPGHFELARHGTLFLDEIAELPVELQPKLLRAIEQKEVLPVGATAPSRTDARIVAATNRRLVQAPWRGNVRELENVLERAMILSEKDTLGLDDLPADLVREDAGGAAAVPDDLRQAVRAFERQQVARVLREAGENREEAARRLGIDASTLYRRLKDTGEAG